jgi:hypothetical protein
MAFTDRLHNRGSISTGYDIDNSLKFEPDNTEYMRRSNGTDGNQRVFTQSMWVKRTEISYGYATAWSVGSLGFRFGPDDTLRVFCYTYDGIGAGTNSVDSYRIITPNKFSDTSAWYHIVFALDTTQGTESDRLKVYVNNERVYHDGSSDIYDQTITQNSYTRCNGTGNSSQNWNQIGWWWSGNYVFAGYIAEVNFVDGLQLSPTDVGEYDSDSGIWKPKKYTGSYGTNGYYLKFDDASDLGKDSSGNNNDMNSIGNITAADQATDTPTNNFCTGNNLVRFTNPSSTIVVDGATFMQKGANGRETISGTMYASSGKWYAEVQPIYPTGNNFLIGVMPSDSPIIYLGGQISNFPGSASGDGGVSYISTGNKYLDGGNSSYGNAYSSGASVGPVIGIALDMDNGKVYFSISNVWQNSGDPTSGATGTGAIDLPSPEKSYSFQVSIYNSGNSVAINYGGYTYFTISTPASDENGYGTFEYAPPSGYYALCTKNLAEYG